MSLRGFFSQGKPASKSSESQPDSAANSNLPEITQRTHQDSQQLRDIKYFMSQAGLDADNNAVLTRDLANAEQTIKNLPAFSTINMDSLAALYQLIPRTGTDAANFYFDIHNIIMKVLLPHLLNDAVQLVIQFCDANQVIKRKLFLNIKTYLDVYQFFMEVSPDNGIQLFRTLVIQTTQGLYKLDNLIPGLRSFYKHSKKKIANCEDLILIMGYLDRHDIQKPHVFTRDSALIMLYFHSQLTERNLVLAEGNIYFVNAARVCARFYTEKDYTFTPENVLREVLSDKHLANYLTVIGEYMLRKLDSSVNRDKSKAEFILQIQALLRSARVCRPDPPRPNPHYSRYEGEDVVNARNPYIGTNTRETFDILCDHNGIDEFGLTKPRYRYYNW